MSNLWPLIMLAPILFVGCGDKEQDTSVEDSAAEVIEEADSGEEQPEDTAGEDPEDTASEEE